MTNDRYSNRTFDPNAGDGSILVATSSDKGNWQRELRDFEAERNEREIRSIMMNRHGVCG